MGNRLNQERQERLEPSRMKTAMETFTSMGLEPENDGKKITFVYKGSQIQYFPYTGWATGKTIKDGRGLDFLVKQLNHAIWQENI